MLEISTITVIGANGTIGSLVSGILASFGNAKIYLLSRRKEDSIKIIEKIKASVRSDAIEKNLIPMDYSNLKEAIENSDWVFEAIIEDYIAKYDIYKKIDKIVRRNTIISSGTSGLAINNLAEKFSIENRKRFFGTHFFNPPYNLNLCEIIPSKYTDKNLIKEFEEYSNTILFRNTITVKDTPGFLANRIGFEFLNKVLQLAEDNKENGGIDYIDSLFCGYTGRVMKPLETIDFVGLDVHKAIVDNIYQNTDDEFKNDFILPQFVNELINSGSLGNKTGCGLYRKIEKDGKQEKQVFDISTKKYRKIKKYENKVIENITNLIKDAEYEKAYKFMVNNNSKEIDLVLDLLINYIVYSLIMSKKYANNIQDCDDAMTSGFNWCPPIAMKKLICQIVDINKLIDKFVEKDVIEKYHVYDIVENSKTKYDYRKYLKATY